jgi:hypothetical protein
MTKHEKKIDDVKKVDLINEIYYIKKMKCIKNWINVDVAKRSELKNRVKNQRQVTRYTWMNRKHYIYILTFLYKIAQEIHHTILETRYDIQNITIVDNDENSLWKNIDDDSHDFILQARKKLNDIKNEEKQSRDLIDENRIKEFKQMIAKDRKHLKMFEFHVVQNFWRFVIKFLTRKIDHLNLCELKCWSCVDLFLIHVNTILYDNLYDSLLNYTIKRWVCVLLFFRFFLW